MKGRTRPGGAEDKQHLLTTESRLVPRKCVFKFSHFMDVHLTMFYQSVIMVSGREVVKLPAELALPQPESSEMADQHPVIPPVAIKEFTCAGNGLLYEGHPRESPADLRLLVVPQGDKNRISDRDREVYTTSCIVCSINISLSLSILCPRLASTCIDLKHGGWHRISSMVLHKPKLLQSMFFGLNWKMLSEARTG